MSKFDGSQISYGGRDADLESIYSDVADQNQNTGDQNTFYNRGQQKPFNPRLPSRSNSYIYSSKDRIKSNDPYSQESNVLRSDSSSFSQSFSQNASQYQWSTSKNRGGATGRGRGASGRGASSGGRGASSGGRGQGPRFSGQPVKLRPLTASSMTIQQNLAERRRRKKEADAAQQDSFICISEYLCKF